MSNLIQVKRSTTNAAPAAGTLQTGELAYSLLSTSNSLFVGDGSNNAIRIGGGNYLWLHQSNTGTPGTLTANAVAIVNGNSFISEWRTNALTVGVDGATVSITNVSTSANTTQLGGSAGGSNTELVSSWAIKTFVDGKVASAIPILTDTFVGVGNTSNYLGGTAGFTFNSSSNTLAIGNSSVNTTITPISVTTGTVNASNVSSAGDLAFSSGGGTASMQFKGSGLIELSTAGLIVGGPFGGSKLELSNGVTSLRSVRDGNITLAVGSNDAVTSTWTFSNTGNFSAPGNATVTGVTNAASFNSTGTATSTFANNVTVNGVANVTTLNVSGVVAEGNTTVTGFVNVSSYGTFGGAVNAASLNVSGAANVASLNVSGITAAGNTTVTGFINVSSYATIGGTANAAALNVSGVVTEGNTTVTGFVNVSSYGTFGGTVNAASLNIAGVTSTGNTTVTGFVNVSSYGTFGGAVNAASLNVSGAANVASLDVAGVTTTGNTTVTGFVNISSYATIGGTANAAALNVSGVTTTGNTTVTGFINVSSYGTYAGVVNAASFNSTGTATSTFANNVTINGVANVVSLNVSGDTTISGNLYVSGNLVSINVATLSVTDSLIQLAVNNYITPDILDIGLYGSYGVDANTNNHRHTGFFRDATDGVWKLFNGLLANPTTTVETTNATYTIATLQAQLSAGGATATGLIANATTIAITANSTLNVSIVANTLTLSTALSGTSGGTGLASFTAEDILVANSSNGFRKLAAGTEGYVLQISSGVVAYNTLDGGSF